MGSRNLCDPICLPFHVIIWVYKKLQEQNIQESLKMLTVIFSKLSIEKNKAAKRWLSMISCLHFFVCCSHLLARPLGIHTKSLPGALPVCTTALQSSSHQGNLSNSNLSQSVAMAIRAFRPPCWASLPWPVPDVTDTHHRRWSMQQAEDEILMF